MGKEICEFSKEEIMKAIEADEMFGIYANASEEIRRDKEVALLAVTKNGNDYTCVPNELKNDRDIMLAAVKNRGIIIEHVPEEYKNDREIVLAAVKDNKRTFRYASKNLIDKYKTADAFLESMDKNKR